MPVWRKLTVLQAAEFLVISSCSNDAELVNAKLEDFLLCLAINGLL